MRVFGNLENPNQIKIVMFSLFRNENESVDSIFSINIIVQHSKLKSRIRQALKF